MTWCTTGSANEMSSQHARSERPVRVVSLATEDWPTNLSCGSQLGSSLLPRPSLNPAATHIQVSTVINADLRVESIAAYEVSGL